MEHLGSIFMLLVGEKSHFLTCVCFRGKTMCPSNALKLLPVLHTTAIAIFFIEVLVAQARWERNIARDDDKATQEEGSTAETEKEEEEEDNWNHEKWSAFSKV